MMGHVGFELQGAKTRWLAVGGKKADKMKGWTLSLGKLAEPPRHALSNEDGLWKLPAAIVFRRCRRELAWLNWTC